MQLRPGDVLVAFTDGISEAMNLDDEEWGEERLLEAIQSAKGRICRGIAEASVRGRDPHLPAQPRSMMT